MKIITNLLFFLVTIVEFASASTPLHDGVNAPLLRDNSTLTDVRNVLRCLQVSGMPNNTVVATDTIETLIIFSNRTETNTTAMRKIVSNCYRYYAYDLGFTHYKYDHFPDEISYVTTLDDAILNYTNLPHFDSARS